MAGGVSIIAMPRTVAVAAGAAGLALGALGLVLAGITLLRQMRAGASYRRPHPRQPWAAERELGDFDLVLAERASPRAEPEVQRLRDRAAL